VFNTSNKLGPLFCPLSGFVLWFSFVVPSVARACEVHTHAPTHTTQKPHKPPPQQPQHHHPPQTPPPNPTPPNPPPLPTLFFFFLPPSQQFSLPPPSPLMFFLPPMFTLHPTLEFDPPSGPFFPPFHPETTPLTTGFPPLHFFVYLSTPHIPQVLPLVFCFFPPPPLSVFFLNTCLFSFRSSPPGLHWTVISSVVLFHSFFVFLAPVLSFQAYRGPNPPFQPPCPALYFLHFRLFCCFAPPFFQIFPLLCNPRNQEPPPLFFIVGPFPISL